MKKIVVAASVLGLISCGSQKTATSNLVQVSEFSIVTADKDTLYLKSGDEMAEHLRKNWESGAFDAYNDGVSTTVLMLDEKTFHSLSLRSLNDDRFVRGLSHLTNSN